MSQSSNTADRWPAPAKLNLMLRIVGQREDGYHLLQTVFQFVDLCDWLTFLPRNDGQVRLTNPLPGVPEQDDLTVKAAKLLQQETGCKQGITITIDKHLPMGGGLGGGSSDAATTLTALNEIWQLRLTNEKLQSLGLKLGADVPIFVFGHTAWGEGVGEKLEAVSVPEHWIVILKPNCHVETKAIFCAENLTRNSKSIKMGDFLSGNKNNDCLPVVRQQYPLVDAALQDLAQFSEARLTGTGACVFAEFDSHEQAQRAYNALKDKWLAFLVKGLNESPLLAKLNKK